MAEEKTGVARWNEDAGRGRSNKAESDHRRRVTLLACLCVLIVACIACAWTPAAQIKRGLYLKGGTELTFAATGEDDEAPAAGDLSDAARTIKSRLAAAGVSDAATRVDGNTLVVDVPTEVDASMLARTVCGRGLVEFVSFDTIGDADALAKLNAGGQNVHVEKGTYEAFLDGSQIKSASVTEVSSGVYALTFVFTNEGSEVFSAKTKELAEDNGTIAILVDGTIVAAASVSEEISGGQVSISGNFNALEANAIKAVVESHELAVDLSEQGSSEVGPLVGEAGLWGLVALAALALVAASVYTYVQYRNLAVLMAGALLTYACVMLGLMALLSRANQFVLTMPGVAGGLLAACVASVAVWRIVASFVGRVRDGKSVRGAAITCVGEGTRALIAPVAVCTVAAMIGVFLPWPSLREASVTLILGLASALVAVFWYAVTLLRLLAAKALQSRPAAWGLADGTSADVSANEGVLTT